MPTREEIETMLNGVRDTDPDIWETLPKPVWYMEKYNCYPRYLSLMEAYAKSIDNTKRYTSNKIEVRESVGDFPELPPSQVDKLVTVKQGFEIEEKEETTD